MAGFLGKLGSGLLPRSISKRYVAQLEQLDRLMRGDVRLASAQEMQRRIEDIVEEIRALHEEDPSEAALGLAVALLFAWRGAYKKSAELLDELDIDDEDLPDRACDWIPEICFRAGRREDVLRWTKRLERRGIASPVHRSLAARAMVEFGRYERATATLSRLLQETRSDPPPDAVVLGGLLYMLLEADEVAASFIRRYLDLATPGPILLFGSAAILSVLGGEHERSAKETVSRLLTRLEASPGKRHPTYRTVYSYLKRLFDSDIRAPRVEAGVPTPETGGEHGDFHQAYRELEAFGRELGSSGPLVQRSGLAPADVARWQDEMIQRTRVALRLRFAERMIPDFLTTLETLRTTLHPQVVAWDDLRPLLHGLASR